MENYLVSVKQNLSNIWYLHLIIFMKSYNVKFCGGGVQNVNLHRKLESKYHTYLGKQNTVWYVNKNVILKKKRNG